MKKLIAAALVIAMFLSTVALADGKLGMTMDEFITKYNSVQAPIGSPYLPLKAPYRWTIFDKYRVAWFMPCTEKNSTILLLTEDKDAGTSTAVGLDKIQIFSSKDWKQLLSVATRCTSIFASDLFGTSLAPLQVANAVTIYFENNAEAADQISYRTVNDDQTIAVGFFHAADDDYFQISLMEEYQ